MSEWNSGETEPESDNKVIPFRAVLEARRKPANLYFTDAERTEIREMLAWYRDVRPKLELIMTACPTARREIAAMLRGD